MSQAEINKAEVEKATAAWAAGTGGIFDIISPDVVWTVSAVPVPPCWRVFGR